MTDQELIAQAYKSLMTHTSQLTREFVERWPRQGAVVGQLLDAANEHVGAIKVIAATYGVDLEDVLREHAAEQGFEIPEELFNK